MTVPVEKMKKMAVSVRRRERGRRKTISARVAGAFAEADRLVVEFRALDPDIDKIVLFGSLARKDARSIDLDIDLAVACSKERTSGDVPSRRAPGPCLEQIRVQTERRTAISNQPADIAGDSCSQPGGTSG